ncbi:conserved hypothetical protein [Neospora caninum Liverpool]|uniref:Uncharacterized protein n=1 Tax=Neospora caninum (strain Liverpool) TaxID=572307 RepID=F0VNN4_NEOCL|nr:conserved hypothetical protein [Neospora caninum Liverpool]CBZ55330.1 conserved hypothetical protein [Neospora caninum Liverpool]CEL70062.1 TPA: hypothetical protein BN1204_057530 [Neospora caninum Liverpool]|eukprot:XP_003885358.1 conserved hypothetical protein [Neospora caninum Liverpool]
MATSRRLDGHGERGGLAFGKRAVGESEDDWEDVASDQESVSSTGAGASPRRQPAARSADRKSGKDARKTKRGFDSDDEKAAETPETDSSRAGSAPYSPDALRPSCDFPWLRGFERSRENRFRCKAATFVWDEVESEDQEGCAVPAYDLPPHLKLLKLSVDASVSADPTTLLRSYLDTLKADCSSGASCPSNLGEVCISLPPSQKKKSPGPSRCSVAYQPPLGDELHIGSSPQKTQVLSAHRFLGTLHFSACADPAPGCRQPGVDEAETREEAGARRREQKRHEDPGASSGPFNSKFGDEARRASNGELGTHPQALEPFRRGIPTWQKESSFMTWHRIKTYGSDGTSCAPRPTSGRDDTKRTPSEKRISQKGEEMEVDDGSVRERKSKEKRKSHRN